MRDRVTSSTGLPSQRPTATAETSGRSCSRVPRRRAGRRRDPAADPVRVPRAARRRDRAPRRRSAPGHLPRRRPFPRRRPELDGAGVRARRPQPARHRRTPARAPEHRPVPIAAHRRADRPQSATGRGSARSTRSHRVAAHIRSEGACTEVLLDAAERVARMPRRLARAHGSAPLIPGGAPCVRRSCARRGAPRDARDCRDAGSPTGGRARL